MKINMLRKSLIGFFVLACIVYTGIKVFATSDALDIQQNIGIQNKQEAEALIDIGERFNVAQDYKSAVRVWSKAARLDPNNQKIYQLIDNALKQAEYHAGLYKGWEKSEDLKAPFTDELSMMGRQVDQSAENMKAQVAAKETVSQAVADKPAVEEREAFIRKTFKDGQGFYDQGDYSSALNQWEKIVPLLPDGHELGKKINEFRGFWSQSKFFLAGKTDQDQTAALNQVFSEQTVRKISDLIVEAQAKLESQNRLSKDQELKAAQDLTAEQKIVEVAVEQGSALFKAGKISEAVQTLNAILPYMKDNRRLKTLLEEIQQNDQRAQIATKNSERADLVTRDVKNRWTESFESLLTNRLNKLKAQIQDAQDRESKAKISLSEEEKTAQTALTKGEALYEGGKIGEALATWTAAQPLFQDESRLKAGLEELRTNYDTLQVAERLANGAEAKDRASKLQSLEDFNTLVSKANDTLKAQVEIARSRRQKAISSLSLRQNSFSTILERGKDFYDKGQLAEALNEWSQLEPYLDDENFRYLLTSLQANTNAYEKVRQSAGEAQLAASKKLALPEDVADRLREANESLKFEIEKINFRQMEAEKNLETRRQWLYSHFTEGQALFAQGKYREAYEVWNDLLPYLQDSERLRVLIAEFNEDVKRMEYEQEQYQFFMDKQKQKFKTPLDLSKVLEDGIKNVKNKTSELASQSDVVQKDAASLQDKVNWTFLDGMVSYEQGKYEKAFQLWESITPYLEDGSRQKALIEEYRHKLNPVPMSMLPGIPLRKGEIEEIPNRKSDN